METDPKAVELVPAPEILVDGYQTTAVINGVVKFTFFTIAHDPISNQMQRRIVLRLSAPLPAVAGMHQGMGNLLNEVMESAKTLREGLDS